MKVLLPTPLEIATGMVCGAVGMLPLANNRILVRKALEWAVLPALEDPPCYVSFSGGRDSSAVLAVAASVARREGLAAPIPITNVFPDDPPSDEGSWQELVVRHLRLRNWERLTFRDELDLLGPVATDVLRRHGVLFPANSYFHVPALNAASGGSLLTGVDGDGLLGEWRRARVGRVLAGAAQPAPRDLVHLALLAAPSGLRRRNERRRAPADLPWLRPQARVEFARAWAEERASEPARWEPRVRWYAARRYHAMGRFALGLLAQDAAVQIVHPFLDRRFLVALTRRRGGFASRTAAMRTLFADLLPDAILTRNSKAVFTVSYWGPHSRAFVDGWTGDGVDPELVDPEALLAEWRKPVPDPRTDVLLQAAWLALQERVEQPVRTPF